MPGSRCASRVSITVMEPCFPSSDTSAPEGSPVAFIQPEILLQNQRHSGARFVVGAPFEEEVRLGSADLAKTDASIEVCGPIQQMRTEVERNAACAGVFDQCTHHQGRRAAQVLEVRHRVDGVDGVPQGSAKRFGVEKHRPRYASEEPVYGGRLPMPNGPFRQMITPT